MINKVDQLSSILPSKERDVLQRQITTLSNDLKRKIEQLKNDKKRIDFECKLKAVENTLMEFEEKFSKVDKNDAKFMKVSSQSCIQTNQSLSAREVGLEQLDLIDF